MPQVSLRLVHIVDALATSSGVLRVERVDSVSSGADAEDEGILRDHRVGDMVIS